MSDNIGWELKFVSNPIQGVDELLIGRHGGNLLTQFFHVAVYGTVAYHPFIGVDPVHELGARVDAAGSRKEEMQEFELNGRQI
jgi:hypothetical protein